MKILIIGCREETNIGGSFERAASQLGLIPHLMNANLAFEAPWVVRKLSWHYLGHLPPKFNQFSRSVEKKCKEFKPAWILSIGISPLHKHALETIGNLGIKRLNFLTDDPWSKNHRAQWFFDVLPLYDTIFSPRRSNIKDLKNLGCKDVQYLSFAVDTSLFYPMFSLSPETLRKYSCDIMFAGGADNDRIAYMDALIKARFKLSLYGIHWERYAQTKLYTHGQANVTTMRTAIASAKIALCLVRRSNRDGHSMRTFEIPAVGTCMLTEDTEEHRDIFGKEGSAVLYFKNIYEMVNKTKFLLNNEQERRRLAKAAQDLINNGKHTYQYRLACMLDKKFN